MSVFIGPVVGQQDRIPVEARCSLCRGRGVVRYETGPDRCLVCQGDGRRRPNCRLCGGVGVVLGLRSRMLGLLAPKRDTVSCACCGGSGYGPPVR